MSVDFSPDSKLRQLLQSPKIPKSTRGILDDISKKKLVYGSFTMGQIGLIDRIFEAVFPTKDEFAGPTFKENVCPKCIGVGVVKVLIDAVGTLCLCDCEQGGKQIWKLPKISVLGDVKSAPLPWEDFKPKADGQSAVRERIAWWKEKVHMAEEFWKSYGDGKLQSTVLP